MENIINYLSKGQKISVFWLFPGFPGFPIPDVPDYNIFTRFWFSWTRKASTIPKMYNFIGIWAKLEELLNFKVTATLRYVKTNKKTNKKKTTDG